MRSFALCSSATVVFNFRFAAAKVQPTVVSTDASVKDSGHENIHGESPSA
jgi:hypothetical protein